VEREKPDWLDVDAYERFLAELPFECVDGAEDFEMVAECLTERKEPLPRDEYSKYVNEYLSCTENLAIYCPSEDAIYYNTDKILEYVNTLSKLTTLYFAKLIIQAEVESKEAINLLRKYLKPVALLARFVISNIVYSYLTAHERYHWSMKQSIPDEEAKATAYGLYTIVDAMIRLLRSKPWTLNMVAEFLPVFEITPFLLGEIAVHIIIAQSLEFKHYREFHKYIAISQKSHVKKIEPPYVRNGMLYFPLTFIIVKPGPIAFLFNAVLPYVEFEFKAEQPGRRDLVREYWGCCESFVDYSKPVACSDWGFA